MDSSMLLSDALFYEMFLRFNFLQSNAYRTVEVYKILSSQTEAKHSVVISAPLTAASNKLAGVSFYHRVITP
jgi:uncharacterized membrane protein